METLTKTIAAIIPFLAQCPHWVRVLAVLWVFFTALMAIACLVCLLWPPVADLQIIKPSPATQVGGEAVVEFRSVYPNLNHYVVVIPLQAPTRWVVDGPIQIRNNGSGSGMARFGNGSVGVGQIFTIEILATELILPDGVLPTIPANAGLSQPVEVNRIR